jgi:hypothetical protein
MLGFGSGQDGIAQHCSSSDVSSVAAQCTVLCREAMISPASVSR